MPSVSAGGSTTSSSAIIINAGTLTRGSSFSESCQLRVMLRYQLIPPAQGARRVGWSVRIQVVPAGEASARVGVDDHFHLFGIEQRVAAPPGFVRLQRL